MVIKFDYENNTRSLSYSLVEQWIMQRGPKCLYGQHDAGIMLLKPVSLRGYQDTMGCIDRSRMKRKSDKAEIADQKKGKQTSEAAKEKQIPRETLV